MATQLVFHNGVPTPVDAVFADYMAHGLPEEYVRKIIAEAVPFGAWENEPRGQPTNRAQWVGGGGGGGSAGGAPAWGGNISTSDRVMGPTYRQRVEALNRDIERTPQTPDQPLSIKQRIVGGITNKIVTTANAVSDALNKFADITSHIPAWPAGLVQGIKVLHATATGGKGSMHLASKDEHYDKMKKEYGTFGANMISMSGHVANWGFSALGGAAIAGAAAALSGPGAVVGAAILGAGAVGTLLRYTNFGRSVARAPGMAVANGICGAGKSFGLMDFRPSVKAKLEAAQAAQDAEAAKKANEGSKGGASQAAEASGKVLQALKLDVTHESSHGHTKMSKDDGGADSKGSEDDGRLTLSQANIDKLGKTYQLVNLAQFTHALVADPKWFNDFAFAQLKAGNIKEDDISHGKAEHSRFCDVWLNGNITPWQEAVNVLRNVGFNDAEAEEYAGYLEPALIF